MPFIRSISGLRATLGDSMNASMISNYALGFAKFCPEGPIIVGRDGRPSGKWIELIVAGALAAAGREVKMIGIVPTPTVQLEVEHSNAAGGIAITASHNPEQWNGLKFLNKSGVFLDAKENSDFWDIVDNSYFEETGFRSKINIINDDNAVQRHVGRILEIPFLKDSGIFDRIRTRKFKVVVDAVNASGSRAVPMLLDKLGCDVIRLACDSSGLFPHTPEPLPQNLNGLCEAVKKENADIGIAVDPDADRLVIIDEKGNPVGEERTIVISTESVLRFMNKPGLKVSVNYSTTRAVEDVAAKYKAKVERSPVGEINVVKKMKECDAVIGGEGSGGVILPECHYGRDSLVGTALLLSLLADKDLTVSRLVSDYTDYSMIKLKQVFSGDINPLIDQVVDALPEGNAVKDDGVKVSFEKSWVQLRASNTEPIVRIMAEAESEHEANLLASKIIDIVKNI